MLGDAELISRIEDGEGDRVEFTASTTDLDKFREAICAFANDLPGNGESGLLFIGLQDDGRCAGSTIDDHLLQTLGGLRTPLCSSPFGDGHDATTREAWARRRSSITWPGCWGSWAGVSSPRTWTRRPT